MRLIPPRPQLARTGARVGSPVRRQLLGAAAVLAGMTAGWPAQALAAAPAASPPPELLPHLPQARLQGQGSLRFFGFPVYDIRLWCAAPVTAKDWAERPLALEIAYARSFSARDIAERSITEMRRQAELAPASAAQWTTALARLIPDVRAGDRVSGLLQPGRGMSFFHNGTPRGEMADAEFARLFIGIWLAPQTSEPSLRAQLLSGPAR